MTGTGPVPAPVATGPSGSQWYATVWADRDYHDLVRARHPGDARAGADVDFPADPEPWEVALRGGEVRLGRRGTGAVSAVETADGPEIELAGPPREPGVSHRHAVLLALPGPVALVVGVVLGFVLGWSWPGLLQFAVVRLNPEAPAAAIIP